MMLPDQLETLRQDSVKERSKAERKIAEASTAEQKAAGEISAARHEQAKLKVLQDELNARDAILNTRQDYIDGLHAAAEKDAAAMHGMKGEQERRTVAIRDLCDRFIKLVG